MPVKPVDNGFQCKAGVEAGGARIAHDMAFRLGSRFRDGAELIWQEGEVTHGGLEFPLEGAGLEGGEERVEFFQVRALAGLLLLDGFDDGGEAVLEIERRKWYLS